MEDVANLRKLYMIRSHGVRMKKKLKAQTSYQWAAKSYTPTYLGCHSLNCRAYITDVHYYSTDVHYQTIAVQMNTITVQSYTITVQMYTIDV